MLFIVCHNLCSTFSFSDPNDVLSPSSPLTVLSSDSGGWIHAQVARVAFSGAEPLFELCSLAACSCLYGD